jgi:mono/diheme cytochrome c family protein
MKHNACRTALGLSLVVISTVSGLAFAGAATPKGDVGRGAQKWVENCMRCHNARDPREFRDDLWRPIVTHMRVRAGLTGEDARDILAYLQASN